MPEAAVGPARTLGLQRVNQGPVWAGDIQREEGDRRHRWNEEPSWPLGAQEEKYFGGTETSGRAPALHDRLARCLSSALKQIPPSGPDRQEGEGTDDRVRD